MHSNVNDLFDNLWQNYLEVTPSATQIHALLGKDNGKDVINDHIALRTFNIAKVNLEKLAAHFEAVGYTACGDYDFEAKKLKAKHFEHTDPEMPKAQHHHALFDCWRQSLQNALQTRDSTTERPQGALLATCQARAQPQTPHRKPQATSRHPHLATKLHAAYGSQPLAEPLPGRSQGSTSPRSFPYHAASALQGARDT